MTDLIQDKIGVELEVGHRVDIDPVDVPDFEVVYDGSIRAREPDSKANEFVSRPFLASKIDSLYNAITRVYDKWVTEINGSMGLHIHQSFPKDIENVFWDYEFTEFFIQALDSDQDLLTLGNIDETLETRLDRAMRGSSDWCNTFRNRDSFTRHTIQRTGRYYIINYSSYGHYGTLECRVWPAMDTAEMAIDAVSATIDIFNEWYRLEKNRLTVEDQLSTGENSKITIEV